MSERTCFCGRVWSVKYTTDQCRVCWLAVYNRKYREKWAGQSPPKAGEPGFKPKPFTWAYGVMTVPQRYESHFLKTIDSLKKAGFDRPRLFVDGCLDPNIYLTLGMPVTCHSVNVRPPCNWIMGLYELYYANPHADRYVMFQDDLVTYKNLRAYLELTGYPENGYCNLYTFPTNQGLSQGRSGWYPSNQRGLGALGLMFDQNAVKALLCSPHMVLRVQGPKKDHSLDGGVVEAMSHLGFTEYVHNPSLVQHTGKHSVMIKGNGPGAMNNYVWHENSLANSFRGEDFDAAEMLKGASSAYHRTRERVEARETNG